MSRYIPPGGNWENIPEEIPSDRLAQIRRMSAERGKCRTTYYGRLNPERPSYTINTWFSKIGNGTFLHYDMSQNRLISQREAARLQSFPDNIEFLGSFTSRFKQIGNAVPPFLFFNIIRERFAGCTAVDLFCGAGGLSVACEWANVRVVCGADHDKNAMETFRSLHPAALSIEGDLTENDLRAKVIEHSQGVDLVLGGPPCQGFSQAGWFKARDKRNNLFREFLEVVREAQPRHFIMENVQGLLWIANGQALKTILEEFRAIGYNCNHFVLSSELFGIPQIRKRVFLTGARGEGPIPFPSPLCANGNHLFLAPVVTVEEALSDLPPLRDSEPAGVNYIGPPQSDYQAFMRGGMSAAEYFSRLKNGRR